MHTEKVLKGLLLSSFAACCLCLILACLLYLFLPFSAQLALLVRRLGLSTPFEYTELMCECVKAGGNSIQSSQSGSHVAGVNASVNVSLQLPPDLKPVPYYSRYNDCQCNLGSCQFEEGCDCLVYKWPMRAVSEAKSFSSSGAVIFQINLTFITTSRVEEAQPGSC